MANEKEKLDNKQQNKTGDSQLDFNAKVSEDDKKELIGPENKIEKGADDFDRVLENVKTKAKEEQKRQMTDYEARRRNFEQANAHLQKISAENSRIKSESIEEQAERIREKKKKEIEKAVHEAMNEDFNWKQRQVAGMAVRIAGDKALDVLYKAAEETSTIARGGGIEGDMIIILTFFICAVKDFSDAFFTVLLTPIGAKVVNAITGFVASAFLCFFWLMAANGWRGGVVTNWILRRILPKMLVANIIQGADPLSIVPVYTITNAWCYLDYRDEQKKAEKILLEINEDIENLKRNVNLNIEQANSSL